MPKEMDAAAEKASRVSKNHSTFFIVSLYNNWKEVSINQE
jgi:hypothetical protein